MKRLLLTLPLALIACTPCPPPPKDAAPVEPLPAQPLDVKGKSTARSKDSGQKLLLCDVAEGYYCVSGPTQIKPPEETPAYEGFVCCAPAGEPCVAVNNVSECVGGIAGWCYYYVYNGTDDDTVDCYD